MIRGLKKALASILTLALMIPLCFTSLGIQAEAASATGAGLAAHAVTAYNQGWKYQYGSATTGLVDCSGLIYTYAGGYRSSSALFSAAPDKGDISTLPRIHGLGLYQPGHVGVYVGSGMAVDARDERSDVVYESVGAHKWKSWFKVPGVSYPSTGWVKYNGNTFYYEDGQYVVSTTKTIDGGSYTFGASGALTGSEPPAESYDEVSYASSGKASAEGQPTPPAKPKELKVGTTDSEVQKMKQRLSELGYYDAEITTYFGEFTGECLKRFQETAGLELTGVADQKTLDALYAEDAPKFEPTFTLGDNDQEIKNVENRLSELSYFYDTPDEGFDEATELAIKDFQTAAGLEATGLCNGEMRSALYAEGAPVNPEAGTMKLGIAGGCIGTLYNRMFALRYLTGETSNVFDEKLESAVIAYQSASGIEETGELSKEQIEVLYSESAVKSPEFDNLKLGYQGEDVQTLQAKLVLLDYYTKEPDGLFSAETEEAVKAFQRDAQLEESGMAQPELRASMDSRIAINSMIANTEVKVEKLAEFGRASAQPRVKAFGAQAAAVGGDKEDSAAINWLWPVMVLMMVLAGTVFVFAVKNPYLVRNLGRKYRIRRNARLLEKVDASEN